MAIATLPGLLALAAGLLRFSVKDSTLGRVLLDAFAVCLIVGAPAAACGALEHAVPGRGTRSRDFAVAVACVAAGAATWLAAVLQVRHWHAVVAGQAQLLDHAGVFARGGLDEAARAGAEFGCVIAVGAYLRRRGHGRLAVVAGTTATFALVVGAAGGPRGSVWGVADLVCVAGFVGLVLTAVAEGADAVALGLERGRDDAAPSTSAGP